MVDTQVRPSDVTRFPIIEAMLTIPREDFLPHDLREAAYIGENLEFAPGRVLLEPRTLAKLLDAMDITPRDVILDIGCGPGYSTAVLAYLAEFVVGIEADAELAAEAQQALSDQEIHNAAVIAAPLDAGAPDNGPYDAIILQGAVEVLPAALIDQLRDGGRIACLFDVGHLGTARIGQKLDGKLHWRDIFNAGAPVLPGFARARDFAF